MEFSNEIKSEFIFPCISKISLQLAFSIPYPVASNDSIVGMYSLFIWIKGTLFNLIWERYPFFKFLTSLRTSLSFPAPFI